MASGKRRRGGDTELEPDTGPDGGSSSGSGSDDDDTPAQQQQRVSIAPSCPSRLSRKENDLSAHSPQCHREQDRQDLKQKLHATRRTDAAYSRGVAARGLVGCARGEGGTCSAGRRRWGLALRKGAIDWAVVSAKGEPDRQKPRVA